MAEPDALGCHSHTLSVRVPLTAGEWASLRELAAYAETSVGGLIGWIVSEDIRRGRPSTRPTQTPEPGS